MRLSAVVNTTETTGTFYHHENKTVRPIAGKFEEYRQCATAFLKSLQAALYFSGGQPPRGDNDLWSLQFRNTSERGRNIFYYDSSLVYVSTVNKTIWKYGRDAGIPHIFPWHNPSKILLRYLLFFRSLEVILAKQRSDIYDRTNVWRMRYYVFQNFNQRLGTAQFTAEMKIKTKRLLDLPHEGLGMANLRQNCIFIARRYVLPAMKDPDNGYAAILDIQAGHSSAVAEALYGVEGRDFPSSVRSSEYVSFKVVCLSLHHFYDIADHSECKLNSPPSSTTDRWNIDSPQTLQIWE